MKKHQSYDISGHAASPHASRSAERPSLHMKAVHTHLTSGETMPQCMVRSSAALATVPAAPVGKKRKTPTQEFVGPSLIAIEGGTHMFIRHTQHLEHSHKFLTQHIDRP